MLTDLIGCRPVPVQLTSLYGELIEAFLQLRNNTAVTSYRLPIFWENWADTFVGHRNRFFDTSKELGSSNFRFKSIVKEARETVALFCHRLSIFPFTDEMKIFHPSVGVGRKSGGGDPGCGKRCPSKHSPVITSSTHSSSTTYLITVLAYT